MTKERFDIHQHITDKIVSAIERGAGHLTKSGENGATCPASLRRHAAWNSTHQPTSSKTPTSPP